MALFFDDDDSGSAVSIPPFHTVKIADEKKVVEWLSNAYEMLKQHNHARHTLHKNYLGLYKGYYLEQSEASDRDTVGLTNSHKGMKRVGVNHTFDLVEQAVSKQTRFKTTTLVVPQSGSYSAESSAKVAKEVLDTIKFENKFDSIAENIKRQSKLFGEGYAFVTWNPNKGPVHPDAKKMLAEGKTIPILDEQGNDTGEFYEGTPRIGQVELSLRNPWEVFTEPKNKMNEVRWCFTVDIEHVEDVRKQYKSASDIKASRDVQVFDATTLEDHKLSDHVVVFNFWHVANDDHPEGLFFRATPDQFLIAPRASDLPNDVEYPSDATSLPFEKLTDIDIPDEQFGWSTLHNLESLQIVYDKLTTLFVRNVFLTAHPKWLVPNGACQISQLGNDATIVSYVGPNAPTLATYQSIPKDAFEFRKSIKEDMEQVSGIQGASRGKPPPNTRATSSLAFFDEQENERASSEIRKYHNFIVAMDTKQLALASVKFKDHDQRMIDFVGEGDAHIIKNFDVSDLRGPNKIRVQNANQFPQSRYTKVDTLLQLSQQRPDLITKETIADTLEIIAPTATESAERTATLSAESENEDFVHGRAVKPPELWEKQAQHWFAHTKYMQTRAFKDIAKEKQDKFKKHVAAHEALMWLIAEDSPSFGQLLQQLPQFPIFVQPDIDSMVGNPAQEAAQGAPQQPQQQQQGPQQPPNGAIPQ